MKNDFFKKYKDPQWQKKRLEILEERDWECEKCGETEDELNVHHGFYKKDRAPWNYPNASLQVLCERCHEERHALLNDIKRNLGYLYDDELKDIFERTRGYREMRGV